MGFLFSIKNLSKNFKLDENRSVPILNGINFQLPNRGLFCICGKSGCGKSTLLNILESLMKPSTGEIFYKNKDISKFNNRERNKYLKDEIGIVFQSFNLINSLTVYENLLLTMKVKGIKNKKIIDEMLDKFNLSHIKNMDISKLSGGEKQRICIIRSLLNSPSVIFADEPTGNLDEKNSEIIMKELKEISKTKLVVLVSHNKKLVDQYKDGSLLIEDGKQINFEAIENTKDEISNPKKGSTSDFVDFLLFKNISKNIKKDLISIVAVIFAFSIVFISLGVKNGIGMNIDSIIENYQDCNNVEISKIDYELINDSNLKFQKTSKINEKELDLLLFNYKNYEIGYDLSYFFSNCSEVTIEGVEFNDVQFIPVNNIGIKNVVYVNDVFKDRYSERLTGSCLNKLINLHLKKEFSIDLYKERNSFVVEESFEDFLTFDIEQINNEFDYLNTPRVYFSYQYFINVLKSKKAYKATRTLDEDITFYDLLIDNNNQHICNYKNIIFFDTFDDTSIFYNRIDKDKYFVSNDDIENINSFKELSSSLFDGAKIFIYLSVSCSCLIVIFLSYYSYVQNKKQSAILTVLGATKMDIFSLYIFEQIVNVFIGFLISFLILIKSEKFLNLFIYQFVKYKDFLVIPFTDIKKLLLILIGGVFLIIFGVFLPLFVSKKIEIYKELKEE